MNLKNIPKYVPGHNLLNGKKVLITASAGTGIGFAVAKKCIEEGAMVFISDIHGERLQKLKTLCMKILDINLIMQSVT